MLSEAWVGAFFECASHRIIHSGRQDAGTCSNMFQFESVKDHSSLSEFKAER